MLFQDLQSCTGKDKLVEDREDYNRLEGMRRPKDNDTVIKKQVASPCFPQPCCKRVTDTAASGTGCTLPIKESWQHDRQNTLFCFPRNQIINFA